MVLRTSNWDFDVAFGRHSSALGEHKFSPFATLNMQQMDVYPVVIRLVQWSDWRRRQLLLMSTFGIRGNQNFRTNVETPFAL